MLKGLKGLKSLFFVIEEEQPGPTEHADTTVPATEKPLETSADAPAEPVNSRFVDVLFNAIQNSNVEGFDYLEFRNSLQSLKSMNMDEATRFRSAFAVAQTMGATVDQLTKSAGHYLTVLQQEEEKFLEAAKNRRAIQVEGKQEEAAAAEKAVQGKTEQIQQLQQEINALQEKIKALQQQLSEANQHIEQTQKEFSAAKQAVSGQIQQDLDNIRQYLQ